MFLLKLIKPQAAEYQCRRAAIGQAEFSLEWCPGLLRSYKVNGAGVSMVAEL